MKSILWVLILVSACFFDIYGQNSTPIIGEYAYFEMRFGCRDGIHGHTDAFLIPIEEVDPFFDQVFSGIHCCLDISNNLLDGSSKTLRRAERYLEDFLLSSHVFERQWRPTDSAFMVGYSEAVPAKLVDEFLDSAKKAVVNPPCVAFAENGGMEFFTARLTIEGLKFKTGTTQYAIIQRVKLGNVNMDCANTKWLERMIGQIKSDSQLTKHQWNRVMRSQSR